MVITEKDARRLWAKIHVPDENGCAVWTGSKTVNGYGRFWLNGKKFQAHRVAYELLVGNIPEGMEIDHVRARGCRSRACCRVDHLEAVTPEENRRRSERSNSNRGKSRCPKGHPYDAIRPCGRRRCTTCHRDAERERQQRRRYAAA